MKTKLEYPKKIHHFKLSCVKDGIALQCQYKGNKYSVVYYTTRNGDKLVVYEMGTREVLKEYYLKPEDDILEEIESLIKKYSYKDMLR